MAKQAYKGVSSLVHVSFSYATHMNLSLPVMPHVSPALGKLSERPATVAALHSMNVDIQKNLRGEDVDEKALLYELIDLLMLLERLQIVTFWTSNSKPGYDMPSTHSKFNMNAGGKREIPDSSQPRSSRTMKVVASDNVAAPPAPTRPEPSTKDTLVGGIDFASLSPIAREKAERMLSQGFPEHLVIDAISRYAAKASAHVTSDAKKSNAGSVGAVDITGSIAQGYEDVSTGVSEQARKNMPSSSIPAETKPSATTDAIEGGSSAGGVGAGRQGLQAKIARMREMGFPEDIIQRAMKKEKGNNEFAHTSVGTNDEGRVDIDTRRSNEKASSHSEGVSPSPGQTKGKSPSLRLVEAKTIPVNTEKHDNSKRNAGGAAFAGSTIRVVSSVAVPAE
jgi:hypothetical protein